MGLSEGYYSVYPHVTYDFLVYRVVEEDLLGFIRPGVTNRWVLMCDLCQPFLEIFDMDET